MMVSTAAKSGSSVASAVPRAMPFADKAYVTQISMHVDADTYAPDIKGLVESGAWKVAEEGVWQGTTKVPTTSPDSVS